MGEHPMLFSAPMVRALLREENPKTVTRRLLNPQPVLGRLGPKGGPFTEEHWIYDHSRFPSAWQPGQEPYFTNIPYAPGDKIWVRETWKPVIAHCCAPGACDCADVNVVYAADGELRFFSDDQIPEEWTFPKTAQRGSNVSPLFMPRWASRLTLEVLSVRAERLQDITEEDALREGVTPLDWNPGQMLTTGERMGDAPYRAAFAVLWDDLNEKATWKSDPHVWRYELRRVEPKP